MPDFLILKGFNLRVFHYFSIYSSQGRACDLRKYIIRK